MAYRLGAPQILFLSQSGWKSLRNSALEGLIQFWVESAHFASITALRLTDQGVLHLRPIVTGKGPIHQQPLIGKTKDQLMNSHIF